MNGHFETNGIYPLSTSPAEGYLGKPAERSGKVVLSHVNGKHVRIDDAAEGKYSLVESREEATQFDNESNAGQSALDLIEKAKARAKLH